MMDGKSIQITREAGDQYSFTYLKEGFITDIQEEESDLIEFLEDVLNSLEYREVSVKKVSNKKLVVLTTREQVVDDEDEDEDDEDQDNE